MNRVRWGLIAAAAIGALGCALDIAVSGPTNRHGYLAAFAFITSTVLGALVLSMTTELAGATWFVVMRRLAEALSGVAPLLPVAFIPLGLSLRAVYPWAGPREDLDEAVRRSLDHLQSWMNAPLFLGRSALFLALWVALAEAMRRASLSEDAGRGALAQQRLKRLSALGLPLIAFSGSFACFDWFMSALAGYTSNIFGLYLLCGGFSSALGVVCIVFHAARANSILPSRVGRYHTHALGRMLLMSVCLWAYIAASQLIIVWSANLPKEAGFYLARFRGTFRTLAVALVFAHFVVPFLLLLSRWLKQQSAALAVLGALVVSMHAVDMYWLLAPAAPRGASYLDGAPFLLLTAVAGLVGIWRFERAAKVPLRAPELERSLAYESS